MKRLYALILRLIVLVTIALGIRTFNANAGCFGASDTATLVRGIDTILVLVRNTTISGVCTLKSDIIIDSGVTLTLSPGTKLFMKFPASPPYWDPGSDISVEIVVLGTLIAIGDSTSSDSITFRSTIGLPDTWGLSHSGSSSLIKIKYGIIFDGGIIGSGGQDTTRIENCRFQNWSSTGFAVNTGGGSGQKVIIRKCRFTGGLQSINADHGDGVIIDNNTFINQDSIAINLEDHAGRVRGNYIYATNSWIGIKYNGGGIYGDSLVVSGNTIEGYYKTGHFLLEEAGEYSPPPQGILFSSNKLITGNGTSTSPIGLHLQNKPFTYYKFVVRKNVFEGFDSAAVLAKEDSSRNFGTSADSGKNVFILPCKSSAKAIIRPSTYGSVTAIGNWFGTSSPDSSSFFSGPVTFRPFLTVPTIPFFGKLGRTSSWASGIHNLEGDFTVDSCATLTLSSGVKVQATANKDVLRSGGDTTKIEFITAGTLSAPGTQTDSIIFSSAAATPANGDWSGVKFQHPGRGSLEFNRISHADSAISVWADTATVKVRNSTFNKFKSRAVLSRSAKTDLGKNAILDIPDCGKNNILMKTATSGAKAVEKTATPSGTLKAEGNWYDSTSPPSSWFVGSVDKDPFLAGPATPDSCPDNSFNGPSGGGEPKIATLPLTFEMNQNYPNPFNPTTTIRYSIAKPSKVELKVYNLLGQEVIALINKEQTPGIYEVTWDGKDRFGKNLSSGIYLYQIRAGDFVQSKKMQILK